MGLFDNQDVKSSVSIAVSTFVFAWLVLAILPKFLGVLALTWGIIGYMLLSKGKQIEVIPDNPVDAVINWVKAFTWPAHL